MRYLNASILLLILLSGSANASQFCFAFAETYYEQVYCQLQARAQVKNLPPFHQFKKNNEQVQFSLLKRPAERNAIKLAPPVTAAMAKPLASAIPVPVAPASVSNSEPEALSQRNNSNDPEALKKDSECVLRDREIICPRWAYTLTGNKANHRLAAGALESHNQMALPGVVTVAQGLVTAYEKYIAKMCEIGLCAVTMTYRKFAFLYQDLQAKGLDFSQRFETMFAFLKKDKAAMAVSEAITLPAGLDLSDCSELGEGFYVCDYQGRNFVFAR